MKGDSQPIHRISKGRRDSLKRYGLTPDAYNEMLVAQEFRCKICKILGTDAPRISSHRGKDHKWQNGGLCVDHDHETKKVRGLLCTDCNRLLGAAKDNPNILLKAIQYLKGRL